MAGGDGPAPAAAVRRPGPRMRIAGSGEDRPAPPLAGRGPQRDGPAREEDEPLADQRPPDERRGPVDRLRGEGARPERAVRRVAHALGPRFRPRSGGPPGTPDLVLFARREVVLVHGCSRHRHPGRRRAALRAAGPGRPSRRPETTPGIAPRRGTRPGAMTRAVEDPSFTGSTGFERRQVEAVGGGPRRGARSRRHHAIRPQGRPPPPEPPSRLGRHRRPRRRGRYRIRHSGRGGIGAHLSVRRGSRGAGPRRRAVAPIGRRRGDAGCARSRCRRGARDPGPGAAHSSADSSGRDGPEPRRSRPRPRRGSRSASRGPPSDPCRVASSCAEGYPRRIDATAHRTRGRSFGEAVTPRRTRHPSGSTRAVPPARSARMAVPARSALRPASDRRRRTPSPQIRRPPGALGAGPGTALHPPPRPRRVRAPSGPIADRCSQPFVEERVHLRMPREDVLDRLAGRLDDHRQAQRVVDEARAVVDRLPGEARAQEGRRCPRPRRRRR